MDLFVKGTDAEVHFFTGYKIPDNPGGCTGAAGNRNEGRREGMERGKDWRGISAARLAIAATGLTYTAFYVPLHDEARKCCGMIFCG